MFVLAFYFFPPALLHISGIFRSNTILLTPVSRNALMLIRFQISGSVKCYLLSFFFRKVSLILQDMILLDRVVLADLDKAIL